MIQRLSLLAFYGAKLAQFSLQNRPRIGQNRPQNCVRKSNVFCSNVAPCWLPFDSLLVPFCHPRDLLATSSRPPRAIADDAGELVG